MDRSVHVRQPEWIVERLEAGVEEAGRLSAVLNATVDEQLSGDWVEAELASEPIG
jgi:hypothetical protein